MFGLNGGYLKASNTDAGDTFGWAIALSGDTLAVGAPNEDSCAVGLDSNQSDDSATNSGAVSIFVRTGDVWTQQAYLKAPNTDDDDVFGWSVAQHWTSPPLLRESPLATNDNTRRGLSEKEQR